MLIIFTTCTLEHNDCSFPDLCGIVEILSLSYRKIRLTGTETRLTCEAP